MTENVLCNNIFILSRWSDLKVDLQAGFCSQEDLSGPGWRKNRDYCKFIWEDNQMWLLSVASTGWWPASFTWCRFYFDVVPPWQRNRMQRYCWSLPVMDGSCVMSVPMDSDPSNLWCCVITSFLNWNHPSVIRTCSQPSASSSDTILLCHSNPLHDLAKYIHETSMRSFSFHPAWQLHLLICPLSNLI